MKKEFGIFAALASIFIVAYYLNLGSSNIQNAIMEAFRMLQWYVRNHTLACVVPAMFIAGGIATFLSKEGILRHLGPRAKKVEAYSVASVSGTILAVCSCSVLPMFAGIYKVGAGLGPAAAFLYSGPAINVMAIFLTARVLGFDLGIARVIGATVFAVVIGMIMAAIFQKDEEKREALTMQIPSPPPQKRNLWQTSIFFAVMIAFLVFSDWSDPSRTIITKVDGTKLHVSVLLETTETYRIQIQETVGNLRKGMKIDLNKSDIVSKEQSTPENYLWVAWVYNHRWWFATICLILTLIMVVKWFEREELKEWMNQTWSFSKSIIPLLFIGVFITGFVGALIPESIVASWVGGNSFRANLLASLIGTFWYFATLTEIPILEALLGLGMGRGPALSLLLAGPALSLPSIAVIYSVLGFKKTSIFVGLTVIMSTIVGMIFGWFFV